MKLLKLLLIIASFGGSLSAADTCGKVIAVTGQAEANARPLKRGSEIFVSDLIKVAGKSKIQIRFTDGGLLNLIELTEYQINSYQFKKTGNDNFTANLIKGGFRELTGEIGKQNPKGVSVKTPVATIGIRGTTFQANIKNGQTFFGVDSGSVTVTNSAGERELNAGQYVSVVSNDQLGIVTDERPEALDPEFFAAPEGGESIDEVMQAEDLEPPQDEEEILEEDQDAELDEEADFMIPENEGNPPC